LRILKKIIQDTTYKGLKDRETEQTKDEKKPNTEEKLKEGIKTMEESTKYTHIWNGIK
jgi:hypothetical protein